MAIDYWSLTKDFSQGDVVHKLNVSTGDLSPYVGSVTAVHRGLGVIDVQWPFGNERVFPDDIVRVNPKFLRYLPPSFDQSYSSNDIEQARKEAKMRLAQLKEAYAMKKVKERIYDAVTLLTQATDNLSFATLANNRTFYLGLSNVLKQPEFRSDSMFATQVIEVIEDNDNFLNILLFRSIKF